MTVVDTSERVFPRHRLANGLQIVAQPMEGVESASLGFLISAGARTERPTEAGISHFVEALGFQGTANRSVQELTEAFENIGAHPESGTETEFTSYSTTLLGRNLAPALELLTDVVLHPGFVPEEIPKARDRILQEIAQREDEPMRKVLDLLRREYFKGHPLGNEVLGTTETITALTREDLQDYWRRQYTAGSVVLAVAGKLDFDTLVAQVEEFCADWPAGEGEPMPPVPPPQRHATVVRKDSAQQHIGMGFPAVPAGSDDFYAMALLAATLGGSMNSRLFLEVREKRSLAYGIGAYFTPLKDAGFVRIYAGTVPEKADQTVAVVLDELGKLERDGVTEDELRRAKTLLKSNVIMRSESTAVRRRTIATSWWYEGRIRTLEEIKERIDAVTTDDIKRLAGALGMTTNVVLTAIGPRSQEELTGGKI
jgi:predicted Zn-dependent peptidase